MCYPWTCLFYSRLCYLDVFVLQQTVLPARVCSTANCATWTCLFYSSLCYLDVSVLLYSRLCYLDVSVHTTACPAPGLVCCQAIRAALGLGRVCSYICCPRSSLAYSSLCCPWKCLSTRACAAPGSVCLQEPVLHLYVQCTNCTCAFVLHLKVSVYKRLCCTCNCSFLPALEVSVYKSLYCTCMYNVQIVHVLLCCP
jgi:hypothetical protein